MRALNKAKANEFLEALVLKAGSHSSVEQGACIMEAVAFVAGEPWSDQPAVDLVERMLAVGAPKKAVKKAVRS